MAEATPTSPGARTQQWAILGGLRFWLAAIVMCGHLRWFVPKGDLLLRFGAFDGHVAVIGFLIISGFSIAHSISRRPKGFYRRRVLRIYPLYLAALIASLVPFVIVGSHIEVYDKGFTMPDLPMVLGNVVLLQGLIARPLSSNPNVWTLSIEFWCYLLAPLLIRTRSRIIYAGIAVSVVSYALYSRAGAFVHVPDYSFLEYGLGFLVMAWAWLFGFVYFRHRDDPYLALSLLVVGVMALQMNTYGLQYPYRIVPYVTSVGLVLTAPRFTIPPILARIAEYLGDLSYPLYLFHLPAFIFGYSVLGLRSSPMLVGFALLISALSYHLIDVYSHQRRSLPSPPVFAGNGPRIGDPKVWRARRPPTKSCVDSWRAPWSRKNVA